MVTLDFSQCKTPEDVERIIEAAKPELNTLKKAIQYSRRRYWHCPTCNALNEPHVKEQGHDKCRVCGQRVTVSQ